MSFLEKIKHNLANLDINAAIATIVTTFGSMSTTEIIQLIYTTLSIVSAIWTLRVSSYKNKLDNDYRKVEIGIKQAELDLKKIEITKLQDGEKCNTTSK